MGLQIPGYPSEICGIRLFSGPCEDATMSPFIVPVCTYSVEALVSTLDTSVKEGHGFQVAAVVLTALRSQFDKGLAFFTV